ncbi:MAG: hypothetical protein ABIN05_07965 [candidate division WOR-3 bacterium]
MAILDFLVGKKVKVIFDDGRIVFTKEAIFIAHDDKFIYIENKNNTDDVIPFHRLVRIEIPKGDSNG